MVSNFFIKKIFLSAFTIQIDPLTRKVSKTKILLILQVLIFIVLVFSFTNPLEGINQESRDRQRVADLNALKVVLTKFQEDTRRLPDNGENGRFRIGGKDSLVDSTNNWLGVNLESYLQVVPKDPKFGATSTAPYGYRFKTNGFDFKLDAFLENDDGDLMQLDGGIYNDPGRPQNNRARFEVGTDLSLSF